MLILIFLLVFVLELLRSMYRTVRWTDRQTYGWENA